MGADGWEPVSPDRAFRLLSDGTRVAIVRAVWAASDDALSFTELRERVGNPDSGRFNYHLDELRGHYLAKTDDGYELTQAGREVVRAVLAGVLTERPEASSAPIDGHCADCGASLVAGYDEYGVVECPDCGSTVMWNEFPPAGLGGRTPEAFAEAFDRWTQSRFRLAMDGVCPNCACEMTTEILDADPDARDGVSTRHRCGNCKYEARVPLFGHVVRHPAVVSFFYELGVDVTRKPYWELQSLAREFTVEAIDRDPFAARVTIEAGGRRLRLALDERLHASVVDPSA